MSNIAELPSRLNDTLIELVETYKECDYLVFEERITIEGYNSAHARVHAIYARIRKLEKNRDTYTSECYQALKAVLLREKEGEASFMSFAREEVKEIRLKIKKAVKLVPELKKQWEVEGSKVDAGS